MRERWNDFVRRSRCGTFLFDRGYMDYHSSRFTDCSLMAFNHRGRLLAVLPAEIDGQGTLASHRGLTYGGWVTPLRHFNGSAMLDIFASSTAWMRDNGVKTLLYKALPDIYPVTPAQEDRYALWRHGAAMSQCALSSALSLRRRAPRNESTRQALRLAAAQGITLGPSDNLPGYWSMLTECLASRHGASPVHTLEEMTLLAGRFPDNIRLFTATRNGEILAGALVYFCTRTAHTQYMATTPEGRQTKALAALLDHIAAHHCAGLDYLDLGGSNEEGGQVLNSGLLLQKSGHGATGVIYPVYTLSLT